MVKRIFQAFIFPLILQYDICNTDILVDKKYSYAMSIILIHFKIKYPVFL